MPSATIDDEDLKKFISMESGYQVGKIVSKKINDKGEVVVFWRS